MKGVLGHENDLSLMATELRLGLPGTEGECDQETVSTAKSYKRAFQESEAEDCESKADASPVSKSQIVGWPPVRSYRKNSLMAANKGGVGGGDSNQNGMYVKVSMDGAPYLRKIDLKMYKGYQELLSALENMFKLTIGEYSEREGYKGSEYAPAYEDKDGDLMLLGDVPWGMFLSSCKRLRIMKGSEARGLGCGL